ncbi:GTP-binding protein [Bacillus sp. JCM 19034]|uniref:GTP-binding protein n=1 Tax=Bacillus sp. JCM 19034 TaxID=1481928 RepID=UPI00078328C0|nr:GTP-binding protein [Bacillus sp. JCM 19034]
MKQNPTSKALFSTFSNIQLDYLFSRLKKTPQTTLKVRMNKHKLDNQQGPTKLSYSKIKSITLPLASPISKAEIEAFLKKWRNVLIRAKGYVDLGDGTYLMQNVMKRVSWERSTYNGDHYLVLIGMNLNIDEIKQEWENVVQEVKM